VQLLLKTCAFREVANRDERARSFFGRHRAGDDLDGKLGAVFVQANQFRGDARGAVVRLGEMIGGESAVNASEALGQERISGLPQQFTARIAKQSLCRFIGQHNAAFGIYEENRVRHRIQQSGEWAGGRIGMRRGKLVARGAHSKIFERDPNGQNC
jgi:hypothetical protein